MDINGKKINFLGDSITEGSGTSGKENTFCSLISKEYNAVCRNYGIGGTRIARQQHPRPDVDWDNMDFCSRVEKMDTDADAVVVFGGTNDFGHGDAPLGKFSDRTPDTFYGALHTLYISLIEKYPGKPIIVLTPLHRLNENSAKGDNKAEEAAVLKRYVDIIREVAEYYSLPVLDLWATSGLQPSVPIIKERFMPDGLHPNNEGHIILARKICGFLKNI